ncbi:unnamed protein product [Effrenium voratum]|uniref:Uncharacterized protein n=1 Tax=Effrenium voratum TaxID=2562239 RepID=A0AA36HRB8_9DINO|nr:unnamed protein product [Effrenium voratum]
MKQMTSTISGQAFPVSRPSSPDLTSRIEPSASQTLSVGLVQHAHLAPSGQAGSAPDPRIRQELSKVQQEVKDLARTVSELSGARHAFALRVDLEAQAKTQRNLDQQLLETRLQLNEEVRSLQRHGAELCQGCEERLADQLEHEKAALVAGLSEAGLALAQLQEGSEAQARRLQEQLDAQGRQLQSLAEGLKNADIAKINYQIEELTKDTVSLFDSLASKAEGEETQQLSGEVAKAQARLAEDCRCGCRKPCSPFGRTSRGSTRRSASLRPGGSKPRSSCRRCGVSAVGSCRRSWRRMQPRPRNSERTRRVSAWRWSSRWTG